MAGRGYDLNNAAYRYGFNGKENDNEVKGAGSQQDYGMRIYDNRLGRFLSVDPLQADYPWWSPYAFAGNSPVLNVDLDGLETYNYNLLTDKKTGKSKLSLSSVKHGSLADALTVQKVDYNGATYTIDAEWNYAPYHGFDNVKKLEGQTPAQLKEYFSNRKTDSQQEEERRQKSEEAYEQAGSIVFGGAALNQKSKSSPDKGTKEQVSRANGDKSEGWDGPVDYSKLKQPRKVGPGLETTPAQRKRILEHNKKMNRGVLKSDEDGSVMNIPKAVSKGGKADMNQAEVDHVVERVNGGSNSNGNLKVISKQQNLKKESERRKQ